MDQCIRIFSVFVIIRRIHSWHFQIFKKDEYWRIPHVKVSSCNYSSIYARTPENDIRYSPIPDHSQRIDVCVVPPSDRSRDTAGFVTWIVLAPAKHEFLRVEVEQQRSSTCGWLRAHTDWWSVTIYTRTECTANSAHQTLVSGQVVSLMFFRKVGDSRARF